MRPSLLSWSVEGALARYRIAAFVVGTGLSILVFVGVPLQIWAHYQGVVEVVGPVHGIFYIAYLIAAADLVVYRLRWNVLQLFPPILAGLVPGLAFVVEHYTTGRVRREVLDAAPTRPEGTARSDVPGPGADGSREQETLSTIRTEP